MKNECGSASCEEKWWVKNRESKKRGISNVGKKLQITLKAHIIEESEKMSVTGRGRDGLRRGRVQRRLKDRRSKNCRRQINSPEQVWKEGGKNCGDVWLCLHYSFSAYLLFALRFNIRWDQIQERGEVGGRRRWGGGWLCNTHTNTHSVGTQTETEIKHGRDGGGGRNRLHAAISICNQMQIKCEYKLTQLGVTNTGEKTSMF